MADVPFGDVCERQAAGGDVVVLTHRAHQVLVTQHGVDGSSQARDIARCEGLCYVPLILDQVDKVPDPRSNNSSAIAAGLVQWAAAACRGGVGEHHDMGVMEEASDLVLFDIPGEDHVVHICA